MTTKVYGPSPVKRVRRTQAALAVIDEAIYDAVIVEKPVSLRGVFYRVVSAGVVDKTELGYKLVSRRLKELRAADVIPYAWITDGTRLMRKPRSFQNLDQMLDDAAASYRRALWYDQDDAVIVLSEKDAITGTIYPVTAEFDVELGITRGYSSVTFTHSIADTVGLNTAAGKTTWIYQLGDHDPSGVDAWRAFQAQVQEFQPDGDVRFRRLAVTEEQITRFQLPTRPTKTSDSRAKNFQGESVEVDAIPPTTLRAIVRAAIEQHIDPLALAMTQVAEESERQILFRMSGQAS